MRATGVSTAWLYAITVVMALSAFVKVEPAPYDVAIVGFGFAFVWSHGLRLFQGAELIAWCVAIFLVLQIPGFAVAEDLDRALLYALITSYLAVTALLLAGFIDRVGADAIFYAGFGYSMGIVVTFVAFALDLLGVVNFRDLIYYDALRVEGFFKDPNVLGPAAIPALMLAAPISKQLAAKGFSAVFRTAFFLGTVGASIVLVYLSYSRGAWLTAVIALTVNAAMATILRPTVARFTAVACAIIASMTFVAFPSLAGSIASVVSSDEFLLERLGGGGLQRYDDDRLEMQSALIDKASENLMGYGPGQTELFASELHSTVLGSNASHNSYLRVLFENGLAGLLSYLTIIVSTLSLGFVASRNTSIVGAYARPLFASFVAALVSALAVDTLHWRHFWILVALIWGAHALHQRSRVA